VPAEDEPDARVGECAEGCVAVTQRALSPGAPGRRGELVVQRDRAQGAGRCRLELCACMRERAGRERTALLAPRPHGAQPDADEALGPIGRLGRLEDAFPGCERACEPSRHRERDVVVPRHREERRAERTEELAGSLELGRSSAVREIAGGDDELGGDLVHELAERRDGLGRLGTADVQVRDMENPCCHGRGRLYTRTVADEAPELFDDIYLGLRAGGAVRKQRRGELLSAEEEEAIGRWQRLSLWRKSIAVGAFALGTFGLGFTVGGLIFGRWRTARR
jgi:hypothetical protein